MGFIWFWLVAIMIVLYVLLDGFDLGVGILHPFIAKTEAERSISIRSIGPVWDGNEVWLLAGGGTLYFAFPLLYASAFSGFYLALMVVLWLLIIRGASIECIQPLRHLGKAAHHDDRQPQPFQLHFVEKRLVLARLGITEDSICVKALCQ